MTGDAAHAAAHATSADTRTFRTDSSVDGVARTLPKSLYKPSVTGTFGHSASLFYDWISTYFVLSFNLAIMYKDI